jgi:hypothetical protein
MKKGRQPTNNRPDAIRNQYEQHGVEHYYEQHATTYANPHFPEIEALVRKNIDRIPHENGILDFCAGAGEVTMALKGLGITALSGADPFTAQLYQTKTGYSCATWSFSDVIKTGIPYQYSSIICSFALHLCPQKDLFSVTWQLLCAAPHLIIITPHKRPVLENLAGITLTWEDDVLTERGKKVRMRCYMKI